MKPDHLTVVRWDRASGDLALHCLSHYFDIGCETLVPAFIAPDGYCVTVLIWRACTCKSKV